MQVPGLLTAVIARAPVIGAKVTGFDASRAKAVAGVKHVVQIDGGVAVVADRLLGRQGRARRARGEWDSGTISGLSSKGIREAMLERPKTPGLVAAQRRRRRERHSGATPVEAVYEAPYLAHACMEPMNARPR